MLFFSLQLRTSCANTRSMRLGGPIPPDYTENDIAILRILGDSQMYKGVRKLNHDTPVEVKVGGGITPDDAFAVNGRPVAESLSMVLVLNSG